MEKDRFEILSEKIEKDRQLLEEAAFELRSKIKDLQDHVLGGSVLAKYMDSLVRINEQLISLEKMKTKNELKEKAENKSELESVKKELENDEALGPSIRN